MIKTNNSLLLPVNLYGPWFPFIGLIFCLLNIFLVIPTDALEVNGDIKYYSVTGSAGSHISRGFCENCGSPLISFVEENPDIKFIKAGSLNDSSWVSADSNFFSSSANPWSPVDEDIHTFTHNPEFA